MRIRIYLLCIATLLATLPLNATPKKTYDSLGGYLGFRPENRGLNSRVEFGGRFAHHIDKDDAFRVGAGFMNSTHTASNTTKTVVAFGVHWLHSFLTDQRVQPYTVFGFNLDQFTNTSGVALAGSVGLGINAWVARDWAIYAEGQYLIFGNNNNDQLYSLGITKYFLPPEKKKVVKLKDSDFDGVVDNYDKCPKTPRNIAVMQNGCPVDNDEDRIPDYRDACKNTPKGARVDGKGCMIDVTLAIEFDSNKSNIRSQYTKKLNEFAQYIIIKNQPIEIQGHTDSSGRQSSNKRLSQKRAESVKAALVSRGVKPAMVTAKGYGESQPVADNKTKEGRQKNRRITVKIVD